MNTTEIVKTDVNTYLFDRRIGVFLNIDNSYEEGIDEKVLKRHTQSKLKLLKSNGFFQKESPEDFLGGRLEATTIKTAFANCRQVIFETTQDCNLSCKYCAFGEHYSNYEYVIGNHNLCHFGPV